MQSEYNQEPRQQKPQSNRPAPPSPGGTPGPAGGPPRQRMRIQMPTPQPTFTYILLGAIIVIYLLGQIFPAPPQNVVMGYRVTTTEDWMVVMFAKVNDFILKDGQVYRLLTSIFLHNGIAHLFFNGWALYVIGKDIEQLFGHVRFLLIYFLGGLTASVASVILNPQAWSVGASGALFAIFGAEMVFLYRNRALFGQFARSRLRTLLYLLGLNLLIGVVGNGLNSVAGNPLIDNWAHVGGFLSGVALAWLIGPLFKYLPPVLVPAAPAAGSGPGGAAGSGGAAAPGGAVGPTHELVVPLEDLNTPRRWLFAPFAWAALLVLVVGALLATQG